MELGKRIVESIVSSVISEAYRTSVYHSLIRKLYKVSRPWTSHLYRDDDWSNLHGFVDELGNLGEVEHIDCWCDRGGYEDNSGWPGNRMPTSKVYKLLIHTTYDSQTGYNGIKGEIVCHFNGTMEDPMSAYDMTASFWINKDKGELDESAARAPRAGDMFPLIPGKEHTDLIRMLCAKYGLQPHDFKYLPMDGKVKYVPKSRSNVRKEKISKPEGMSVREYYDSIVMKVNPKVKEEEGKYQGEVWRPVKNVGRYFEGTADYTVYEVSNYARLRLINMGDAMKCRVLYPYAAPKRMSMQFHLRANDDDGRMLHTCPDVKNIVADAFIDGFDPSTQRVVHKDGDWRNNNLDNLLVIDRGRKVKKQYNIDEAVDLLVRRYMR